MQPTPALILSLTITATMYLGGLYATANWLARPHFGLERLGTAYAAFAVAVLAAVPVLMLVASVTAAPGRERQQGLLLYGTWTAVDVSVLWRPARAWHRGRATRRAKTVAPFDWFDYGVVAAALVLLHYGLVRTAGALTPSTYTDPTDRFYSRVVLGVLMFLVAQVTTSWAVRSLGKSLRDDWAAADGEPFGRDRQYLLVAAPVVACLVPSAFYGALLAGIVVRLVLLALAWACTEEMPCTPLRATRVLGVAALRQGWRLGRVGTRTARHRVSTGRRRLSTGRRHGRRARCEAVTARQGPSTARPSQGPEGDAPRDTDAVASSAPE